MNEYLYNKVKKETFVFAHILRKNQTPQEKILWEYLRRKNLGVKIRRQHIVRGFIVDFFCSSANLIIEVDGDYHKLKKNQDAWRTQIFNSLGLRVLRFKNSEVENNINRVLNKIRISIQDGGEND